MRSSKLLLILLTCATAALAQSTKHITEAGGMSAATVTPQAVEEIRDALIFFS
jgi:hypothetical protein